ATPVTSGLRLEKNETQSDEDLRLPYRELVGALTYLASTTRPDISFAVSNLGQYNNCFGANHWKAAKRVLRYLKGNIDVGLTFGSDSGSIVGFADADWGNTEDRRSFSGYIFMLNGGPVSWESRKQRTVALSTTEAEYMALTESSKEAIFLRRFLIELGSNDLSGIIIYCDNQSAMKLTENPVYHGRSKHIDIRHHFIREAIGRKEFHLKHISTEDQAADFLTKGLVKAKHIKCAKLAGL
ncbi:Retrovirus-related Pol polyprotein from transposon TNT 1-94, partial [Camponotus floridanus]